MLSRVASSIYWMARYCERAENLARFIEVTESFSLDQPDNAVEQWEPLIRATGDEQVFEEQYGEYTAQNVCQFLSFDRAYHSSIRTCVSRARENARTVREAISSEAWEELNTLYHFVRQGEDGRAAGPEFYDQIVQHFYKLTGIMNTTMTHGTGWHFSILGQNLERADKTSRILDVKYFTLLRQVADVNTPIDDLLWSVVLRCTCGFEMFRKRYHVITVPRIVNFLILNPKFPRAILYCIQQARRSLTEIAGPVPYADNPAFLELQRLHEQLQAADAETIIAGGMHEYIDSLQQSLNSVGAAVQESFFAVRAMTPAEHQEQIQVQS